MSQPRARNTTLYTGIVRALRTSALAATFALSISTAALAQTSGRADFDIPEQSLSAALKAFAEQADMQLLYRPETINGTTVRPLKGELDKRQALLRLLEGTDLEVVYSADDAATIRPRGKEPVTQENDTSGVLAGVGTSVREPDAGATGTVSNEQLSASERSGRAQDLETITVTGTRIRGGETPSPVITIGSENIREEGFTDLGEVIRSIPQNFSGGQNPGVASAELAGAGYANANVTGGSSLNLRGLGPDATLTLLNGRRMSYGSYVQAVDISAIPVEAVERIEIVADGASAIYGSDAVGGVGNVVLKRDFDGAAVGVRYSGATDGGLATQEYTATVGAGWLSGGLIATYKDVSTDPIHAARRSYTHGMVEPATLYPGSNLRSGLLSAHQTLGENAEFRLDGLITKREQTHYYSLPSGIFVHITPDTRTSLISPSIDYRLPNDWKISIGGTKGKDEHVQRIALQSPVLPSPTTLNVIEFCYCNENSAYDFGAEGPLFGLLGEKARLAVGVGYRKNEFRQPNYGLDVMQVEGEESSKSAYAEISLPFTGKPSRSTGSQRFVLTAAARREDYDSFGGVTTPKVGLLYQPNGNVTVKASWGESFKAPTLFHRYFPVVAGLQSPMMYGGTGYHADAAVLVLDGGNPGLEPERAKTWTASLALHPQAVPGFEAELTWFDVDYSDRVIQPITSVSQALINPIYAEFIRHAPTPEQQSEMIAAADSFVNTVGVPYDPENVVAIISTRYVNATRQRAKGIDLSGAYRLNLAAGQITVRGSASWLQSFQQTAGTPTPYDLAGTLFNPARFNSRAGVIWNTGAFTGTAFANYKSGVTSTQQGEKSGSFLTFDTTLRYETGERSGFLSGVGVTLAAQNLLNKSPPLYVPTLPMYVPPYDSTNYSAIGRFVGVSIVKHW